MLSNNTPVVTPGDGDRDGAPQVPLYRFEDGGAGAAVADPAVDPLARAPRNARAADVVVEGGNSDREMGDAASHAREGDDAPIVVDTDAPGGGGGAGGRRRRMGEVYPIMKNTIYSDDECEEEVALTAWDCGALFIRYLNGLFQYFVRNPKAMGLIFTTAIILLFFKYSQQVVVKAVNAAVRAHPGLEPTDTLRSAVVSFTEELQGLERVAQTIGWAYIRDAVTGYNIHTAVNTTFFSLVNTFQTSFTANVKTYVVYALPTAVVGPAPSGHWGQIGCASEDASIATCFYVGEDSTARQWNLTTNTGDGGLSVSDVFIEQRMPDLLSVATTATKGSALAAAGVWTRASMTRRIFSSKTVRTISYLLPIAFNTAGYATAMAGIDVSVELLMDTVNVTATPNMEVVVVDNRYNVGDGGQFVYDSFNEALFWDVPYGARNVPVDRIRDLASTILHENSGILAVNGSFYQNGLIYQSLTMMSHWTLIASSPLALSVAEVAATLGAIVKESKGIAVAASGLFRDCESSANKQQNSVTVESFGQIEQAFGAQLQSLYMSYTLSNVADTSSRGSSSSSSSDSSSSDSSSSFIEKSGTSGTTTSSSSVKPHASSTASSSAHVHHHASSSSVPHSLHSSTAASSFSSSSVKVTPPTGSSGTDSTAAHAPHPNSGGGGGVLMSALAATAAEPRWVKELDTRASTSTTGSAAAAAHRWGVCGCAYSSSSQTSCFYTSSKAVETVFSGSVFTDAPASSIQTFNVATSRRGLFTAQYIDGTTTTSGFWTMPYIGTDTITGSTFVAVSYVYPSVYDSHGNVTRAAVLDTTAAWMASALKANQHSGTTALYLIDRRGAGTFLASSTATRPVDGVYPALETPDKDFNHIANAVYHTAGDSWDRSISFHMGPTLVNYQVVEGQWGVVEVMPGTVALERYLPTPAVTGATDALRLLQPGDTVQLFLYVGGILFIYFLNLLILGCSQLGQQ
ncbi:hypothetical protein NESM_000743900 [Novymonas esmeraldas]|uniref:Uncharacterized protein n=1 Tax=Novymonas esmeraldas TaxID=1808958 RepID=A0AAW0EVS3_9TRYP